jgi:hypothetical protein
MIARIVDRSRSNAISTDNPGDHGTSSCPFRGIGRWSTEAAWIGGTAFRSSNAMVWVIIVDDAPLRSPSE